MNTWRNSISAGILARWKWLAALCSVALAMVVLGAHTLHAVADAQADSADIGSDAATALRQCPPDIQFGEVIQCSIAQAAEIDTYIFLAVAGDKVLLRLLPNGLDPGMRIYGPDGTELPNCRTWGRDLIEIASCTLPETGAYSILVYDDFGGVRTGSYNLFLQRLYTSPNNAMPISFGQIIFSTIDTPVEMDVYSFSAAAGEKILLRLLPDALDPGMRVYAPDGVELPDCRTWGRDLIEVSSCTLPMTGVYFILVYDDFDGVRTGSYHLYLQKLYTFPSNTSPIYFDQIISATIAISVEMDVYTFSAAAGDKVLLRLVPGPIDPGMRIYGPDGVELPGCRTWGRDTIEIPSCTLPATGTYFILAYDDFGAVRTGGYTLLLKCLTLTCGGPPKQAVVLVYAVLDNNLGDEANWNRLVNNAELGVRPDVHTHLLIDGPGASDAYTYTLHSNADEKCPSLRNPICGGYVLSDTLGAFSEDTAHPDTLANFAVAALQRYSTTELAHVSLILAGHGGGWSANALPGQPSRYGRQDDRLGGMLWDDNPGNGLMSRSLSTQALGYALDRIQAETGRAIDILYLDACSMGMAEVAYEVRNSVRFLLASANTDWASFAYDHVLAAVDPNKSPRVIAAAWLAAETQALRGGPYPFVMALYQLEPLGTLAGATKALAAKLAVLAPGQVSAIDDAFDATVHYESDYNGVLDSADKYADLRTFLQQLQQRIPDDAELASAIQAVNAAQAAVVLEPQIMEGSPWAYPNAFWRWPQAAGLGIYLPLRFDEAKRLFYRPEHLAWVSDSGWDQFLSAYWAAKGGPIAGAVGSAEMPVCHSTRSCEVPPPRPLQLRDNLQMPVIYKYLGGD